MWPQTSDNTDGPLTVGRIVSVPRREMFTLPDGYTVPAMIGHHSVHSHIKLKQLHGLRLFQWEGWHDRYATPTARAIAAGIVESGDWTRLLLLADAVQDAGCEDAALLGLMRVAGVLGLDMGGWWLMERLCPPERLPQFAKLISGGSSNYNYASARLSDPRQGGEESKRK